MKKIHVLFYALVIIFGPTAAMAFITERLTHTESALAGVIGAVALILCCAVMVFGIFAPAFLWHFRVSALEREAS